VVDDVEVETKLDVVPVAPATPPNTPPAPSSSTPDTPSSKTKKVKAAKLPLMKNKLLLTHFLAGEKLEKPP
jgi:hypothetical protein